METAAVAAVCEARRVPWSVFRGISDLAGDPAIDDALVGLAGSDGSANVGALTRYLLRHPGRVRHLNRLGKGMRAAAERAATASLDVCRKLEGAAPGPQ